MLAIPYDEQVSIQSKIFILFIYLFIYLQLTNLQLKTDIVLHTNKNSCFSNKKTC